MGVVGTGRFGSLHALTINGLPESDLVALVDSVPASLDRLPPELSDISKFTDLDEAIAETGAEAWIVASSTASHVPVAGKLLASGSAVLLEKPLADSLNEAIKLSELADANPERLMLGHLLLFNSEFQGLKAECRRRGSFRYASCYRMRPTRHANDYPGETPFHLTMVHDLYCIQSLVNAEDPLYYHAQKHVTSLGNIDSALAQLQWADGRLATFAAGFLTPEGMSGEGFDRMEVYGDGWFARLSPNPRPLEVWAERYVPPLTLEIQTDSGHPSGMLAEELRCFCQVVRGLEPVPAGARYADGVQVMRWLERLFEAAEQGHGSQHGEIE